MRVPPSRPQPIAPAAPAAVKAPATPAALAKAAPTNGWDRSSYMPAPSTRTYAPSEAVLLGKRVFDITEADSKREALQVGRFLEAHPSRGATQITFFHSYWAQHQTFQKVPLQAYLYHATRPVDDQGRPKNALWQAYADAVETGQSEAVIEEAFLRAHVAEFKAVVKTPEFKQLYALATPKYRQVVEAYLDALSQLEGDMNAGKDPAQVGRAVFTTTVLKLQARHVNDNGFMATWQGVKAMTHVGDALNKQMYSAIGQILTSTIFNKGAQQPAPTEAMVDLSAADAARLAKLTHIPFKAGRQVLTESMLKNASVTELDRRNDKTKPLPRVALKMEDFTAPQRFRGDQRMSGTDHVFDAAEIEGVVRNVQGLKRSQLIQDFYAKYPVPQAGIHLYSANMLSMNGAYGQSEMANTLANGIMPVDNDGHPKGPYWQAYADAYDRHKATGAPSEAELENLWFRAHMEDFKIVDTPAFKSQLAQFWADAAKDEAFAPMAIYTNAMVGGRQQFEKATREHVSEESAFAAGLTHFAKTIATSGTFPFWKQDLGEAGRWLKNRKGPELDDRGLPTEKALFERAALGVKEMTGLSRVIRQGAVQAVTKRTARQPVSQMVDLAKVLTPEQLEQVDPRIVAFYRDPSAFDITTGISLKKGDLSKVILGDVAPAITGLGAVPDRTAGYEGFPVESEIYQDADGHTHWDRYVVVDGDRKTLFQARFEVEGRQLRETFQVNGVTVPLYFDVVPYQGGIRLTLDHSKSSKFAALSQIVFTTVPTAGGGISTTGDYSGKTRLINGQLELHMTPKQPSQKAA